MDALPTLRTFHRVRAGHPDSAYEYACALAPGWPCRAAVADGATETAFAGPWARLLVEAFCAAPLPLALPDLRHRWAERLPPPPHPWYLAEKIREGAAAAFLGLELTPDGAWQALALGDCCLFHLSGVEPAPGWPLDTPAAFGHRPELVRTIPGPAPFLHRRGRWRPGDAFLLASDALAAHLMETDPAGWRTLSPSAFAARVDAARQTRTLRNDDVTLVVVETTP